MAESSQIAAGPFAAKSSPRPYLQQDGGLTGSQHLVNHLAGSGKEEDWEDEDGNELIFALDDEEDVSPDSADLFSPCEEIGKQEVPQAESMFLMPSPLPSPPESDFLPALPISNSPSFPPQRCAGLINPQGPKPFLNLVKSLSTEIEPRDGSSLKPQPLLSLVKSISTEISRLEPEVTQSKSDSKLNVHLWRQITQPKGKNGDSRTAPSSPNISPSESKSSFLKAQEAKFEDTKRRFSEAMHEPLSRLSKIIGEENNLSPKHKSPLSGRHVHDLPSSHSKEAILEAKAECPSETDPHGAVSGQPSGRRQAEEYFPTEQKWGPSLNCQYEICSYGDVIQVADIAQDESGDAEEVRTFQPLDTLRPAKPCSRVPCKALACIAILAYNYFVLPLPAFLSGLCLGMACGFMMGFLIILLLVPKQGLSPRKRQTPQDKLPPEMLHQQPREPNMLKGWMNEMYFYDPEIYHPSLTHSVFVSLEDASMKLSYPKNNISRRATFEEEICEVAFVSHRHYKMSGAKIFLSPPGLARKRMWNKKYPICILFPEQDDFTCKGSSEHDVDHGREKTATRRQAPAQETPPRHPAEPQERTLYLFGRTGRDKEEWFQHLVRASQAEGCEPCNANAGLNQLGPSGKGTCSNSQDSTEDLHSLVKSTDLVANVREKLLLDYNTYMSRIVPTPNSCSPPESPCHSTTGSPKPKKFLGGADVASGTHTAWANAVLGRMFWDFLQEKYWADQVSNKIQKKLGRIKLPYFMNELTLTELDMGASVPHILSASNPTIDRQGLWVDMEVTYNGSLQMTLETKMNLYKLGKEALGEENGKADNGREGAKPLVVLLADSDAESSSAGSSDEDDMPTMEPSGTPGERNTPPGTEGHVSGNSTSRKILRFVDKIAKSKYFQKATENEFIKKKIEEVSNTPLLLTVEVQELTGTLAVNIPPPPTDRIWYSFRIPPQLDLKVRPKLGEREVTFIHVTEWIEKKLQHEFQKVLVMPNMDDLILPLMHSGLESQLPTEGPQKDFQEEGAKKF
ncbi:testis-expressed protein 2-like [Rhineura floridana]|uniref:testis-expressed protein 2-like n=1 Tax=Rhineura floridana TaxID=261503 RepID=UPI002AC88529|nr:testis-expressed protein 2-like [Rhineura floridana]XP_061455128.1 testis-expressed protein 2-like [Rhineura floridana]XP_061455129.1 testis-expressed protein 2-like [Rhineura floridana]XP_061455131.1 testis-expressed protein 2-like [Rhineura floridana]XP_061455132.1 testis-expressed protein 2-like [Rhineura floridana]XP_061455133.1 testis-expressed protein 2-like [Rhineura floridana]XP_061455134.1 testis-expressed protein 2-like [Rhineura floridana]